MVLIDQNVTGQHHQSRLDGPHMQIMNVVHARNRFDGACDVRGADARRCGFKQDFQRFAEDRPGAAEYSSDQQKADERIENGPAGP